MRTNLLQALQILTQLAFHSVCQNLRVFAIDNIALTIKEPCWYFVLSRILNDCNDTLELFRSNITSTDEIENVSKLIEVFLVWWWISAFEGKCIPLVQINIGLLAHQVGVTSPNTLYLSQSVHDLLFAIDIGV